MNAMTTRNIDMEQIKVVINASIGALLLVLCSVINPQNHYLSALLLIFAAVLSYLFIVYLIAERNWLDVSAVFSFVWLLTIGLASFRLTDYQEVWQKKTWYMFAIAYAVFQIGTMIGKRFGKRITTIRHKHKVNFIREISYSFVESRLFWLLLVVTLVGLISFIISISARGMVPFFSSDTNAYVVFYSKLYVFSAAASSISGGCYYCIKTIKLSRQKKLIMYLCILYNTIIFPTLAVSRGIFLASALSLSTAIYYLNKKRFLILISCLLVVGGMYLLISKARNYTESQLGVIFEPSTISVSPASKINAGEVDKEDEGFRLPGSVVFVYSYLTVSHDNFNEAVQNSSRLSYGIRQFAPFNVILRLSLPEVEQTYLVRPHLNTYNLIGDAYYDFHEVGVIISVFIWSCIFGAIQAWYLTQKGPFSLLALGNTVSAVALSFFASWLSSFTFWMFWGVALLLFLVCNIRFRVEKTDQ